MTIRWASAVVGLVAVATLAGCSRTTEYCATRAAAECRQIYEGGCFSAADRLTLNRGGNAYLAGGVGDNRPSCESKVEAACQLRDSAAGGDVADADDARSNCIEWLEAVACEDYRAALLDTNGTLPQCEEPVVVD